MIRTFVYTNLFDKKIEDFKLNQQDITLIERELILNPKVGEVIKGTSGIRKFRFKSSQNKTGKSGGYRIFYIDLEKKQMILLITMISKTQTDNLSKEERNELQKMVQSLKKYYEEGV